MLLCIFGSAVYGRPLRILKSITSTLSLRRATRLCTHWRTIRFQKNISFVFHGRSSVNDKSGIYEPISQTTRVRKLLDNIFTVLRVKRILDTRTITIRRIFPNLTVCYITVEVAFTRLTFSPPCRQVRQVPRFV